MHSNFNITGNTDYSLLRSKNGLKPSKDLLKTDAKGLQTKSILSSNHANVLEFNENTKIPYNTTKKFNITNNLCSNNIKLDTIRFNVPDDEDYYNNNANVISVDYYTPCNIPLINYDNIKLKGKNYTPPPKEKQNYSCSLQVRDYVSKDEEMSQIYKNYIKNIPEYMNI